MPDAPSGYARGSVICFVLKALNFWGSFGCLNVEVEWENFMLGVFFFFFFFKYKLGVCCNLKLELVVRRAYVLFLWDFTT